MTVAAGTMSLNVVLGMEWTDTRLIWDKSKTLGIEFIYSSPDWIYVPDITLQNSAIEFSSGISAQPVLISYRGVVTWIRPGTIVAYCDVQLERFPFDLQTCPFPFASNRYSSDYLSLYYVNDPQAVATTGPVSWEPRGRSIQKYAKFNQNGLSDYVCYYVTVKRYYTTYISTCIMPNTVVTTIAICSLFTSDHLSRLGVALTALLTVIAVMVTPHNNSEYFL